MFTVLWRDSPHDRQRRQDFNSLNDAAKLWRRLSLAKAIELIVLDDAGEVPLDALEFFAKCW